MSPAFSSVETPRGWFACDAQGVAAAGPFADRLSAVKAGSAAALAYALGPGAAPEGDDEQASRR